MAKLSTDDPQKLVDYIDELEAENAELTKRLDDKSAADERATLETQHAAEVADLNGKLDTALAEKAAAEAKYADLIAYFDELNRQAAKEAELADLAEKRAEEASEFLIPEERIAARKGEWARMSDEAWTDLKAGWGAKPAAASTTTTGVETRETASAASRPSIAEDLSVVLGAANKRRSGRA